MWYHLTERVGLGVCAAALVMGMLWALLAGGFLLWANR